MPANPPRYQNLSSPRRSASSVPLWRTPGAKASRLAGAYQADQMGVSKPAAQKQLNALEVKGRAISEKEVKGYLWYSTCD
jgi:hypothetical protein